MPETTAVTAGVLSRIRATLAGLEPGASLFTGLFLATPDDEPASSQSRSDIKLGLCGDVRPPDVESQGTHPGLRGDLLSGLCSLDVPEEELAS